MKDLKKFQDLTFEQKLIVLERDYSSDMDYYDPKEEKEVEEFLMEFPEVRESVQEREFFILDNMVFSKENEARYVKFLEGYKKVTVPGLGEGFVVKDGTFFYNRGYHVPDWGYVSIEEEISLEAYLMDLKESISSLENELKSLRVQ